MTTASRFLTLFHAALIIGFLAVTPAHAAEPAGQPAPGYFRVVQTNGHWWFIDPLGQPFLSKGVCHIQFDADPTRETRRSAYGESCQAKYGARQPWR